VGEAPKATQRNVIFPWIPRRRGGGQPRLVSRNRGLDFNPIPGRPCLAEQHAIRRMKARGEVVAEKREDEEVEGSALKEDGLKKPLCRHSLAFGKQATKVGRLNRAHRVTVASANVRN
jgi:hypothetical protein